MAISSHASFATLSVGWASGTSPCQGRRVRRRRKMDPSGGQCRGSLRHRCPNRQARNPTHVWADWDIHLRLETVFGESDCSSTLRCICCALHSDADDRFHEQRCVRQQTRLSKSQRRVAMTPATGRSSLAKTSHVRLLDLNQSCGTCGRGEACVGRLNHLGLVAASRPGTGRRLHQHEHPCVNSINLSSPATAQGALQRKLGKRFWKTPHTKHCNKTAYQRGLLPPEASGSREDEHRHDGETAPHKIFKTLNSFGKMSPTGTSGPLFSLDHKNKVISWWRAQEALLNICEAKL